MSLIGQTGSDYQLAGVTVDAGHARDIMLMLVDVALKRSSELMKDTWQNGLTPRSLAATRRLMTERSFM
jgi:hypothetical protein